METTGKISPATFASTDVTGSCGQLLCICVLAGMASFARGQTLIPGNVSGIWSPANNPYVVINNNNATVPTSQSLSVETGKEVIIGSNLDFNLCGHITTKGTPAHRITFRGPNDSTPYGDIFMEYEPGITNEFGYGDFRTANQALYMLAANYSSAGIVEVLISNCTFSNCVQHAILARTYDTGTYKSVILPVVRNWIFVSTKDGCEVLDNSVGGYVGSQSLFLGNAFQDLQGTAISLTVAG